MPYTITMVSALSLQEVLLERPIGEFTDSLDKSQIVQLRRTWLGKGHSMLLVSYLKTQVIQDSLLIIFIEG